MISLRTLQRSVAAGAMSAFLFVSGAAQAAIVTYTFTGAIGPNLTMEASGNLAGLFHGGQTFTVTAQFDLGPAPDYTYSNPAYYLHNDWISGVSQSLTIGGQTYTVGAATTGYQGRAAEIGTGGYGYDFLSLTTSDGTAARGGNATSTLAIVDQIQISIGFSNYDYADILSNTNPDFPAAFNLSNWTSGSLSLYLSSSTGSGGDLELYTSGANLFTSATSSISTAVPAPGALALIGFGLLGLAGLRRKAAIG